MDGKSALIVGATGLVGRELVSLLLDDGYYEEIIIAGRRSIGIKDDRLKEVIFEIDEFDQNKSQISATHYYCCIGTTMKHAGSKDAFLKVDHDYPIELAQHAKTDPKFKKFVLVSSYGANADSGIFYNHVKGQTEEDLKKLGLNRLLIFQPSLLLGKRDDFRFFEEAAKTVSSILTFFIIGTRLRFWAIEGSDVAKAMLFAAKKKNKKAVRTYRPVKMMKMAGRK